MQIMNILMKPTAFGVLCVLLVLCVSWNLGFHSAVAAQTSLNRQAPTLPEVQVALVERDTRPSNTSEDILHLIVEVPPHHHGYLDAGDEGFFIPLSFTFPSLVEQGAQVSMVSHPPGERDEVVRATVLRGGGEFVFRVEAMQAAVQVAETIPLLLRYQICNDVTKICYPPQEVAVPLHVISRTEVARRFASGTQASQQAPASLTLNERLAGLFARSTGNPYLAFGIVLVAGLLASATPCVYPMLPITAAIFTARGHGSWRRGGLHALAYCAGLIGFYTLLGLMAATTGTALSAIMTNAWVHLGFAVLFTYLGLSMLGFYELHFFSSLMTQLDSVASRWRGMSGTFCMGATTGLVVSPCIGPITGAILLDITGQVASVTSVPGSPGPDMLLRGVILMTSFGLGLALPFLVVSLLSSKLPYASPWLAKTQYLLALPTLYFAYTYYIKGMEIAAIPLNVAHVLLVGVVALSAALLVQMLYASQNLFVKRTMSLSLFIISLPLLYHGVAQSGWSLGTSPMAQPVTKSAGLQAERSVEVHENLQWWRDFSLAQQRAQAEQKPLFVDFYATWCANCKAFQHLTLSDTRFNAALQEVILVKIYDTDAVFRLLQRDPNYPELRGVGGQPLLPLFAIYSAQGILIWKGQDYQAIPTMIAQLEHAKRMATP